MTPGIFNSSEPLMVGAGPNGAPFEGAIDEARVSDAVRYSGAYAVPSAAFAADASTRALWHFDEALCSKSFADASGNGNTLNGQDGAHTADANPGVVPAGRADERDREGGRRRGDSLLGHAVDERRRPR